MKDWHVQEPWKPFQQQAAEGSCFAIEGARCKTASTSDERTFNAVFRSAPCPNSHFVRGRLLHTSLLHLPRRSSSMLRCMQGKLTPCMSCNPGRLTRTARWTAA